MDDRQENLKENDDFTKAENTPYLKPKKIQITINVDEDVVAYFKKESERVDIPYQTLISLYLRDCMVKKHKLDLFWK